MALEDFESSFERQLDLTDRERVGVVIGRSAVSDSFVGFPYSLVAKVFSQQEVHRDNFLKTFTSLWKGSDEVSIKEIASNRFWVRFVCDRDRQRVLDMEPWSFRRSMVLLATVSEEDCIHTMQLTHCNFWIQINGVPGFCMTVLVANAIGSTVGEVLWVDNRDGQDCVDRFIRVRVRIDVRLPLMRRTPVSFPKVGEKIVEFRYEYLPEYCFACGCLGHPTQECVKKHEALRGKLTSTELLRFTNAFEGLEGVVNLRGKPIGSSVRRLFSQQQGLSHTRKMNDGEASGGQSWRGSRHDSEEATDTASSPLKHRPRREVLSSSPRLDTRVGCCPLDEAGVGGTAQAVAGVAGVEEVTPVVTGTPPVSELGLGGPSTVVPTGNMSRPQPKQTRIVPAAAGPSGEDKNAILADTGDPFNFMPLIEQSAGKVKGRGRGRGRPRRVVDPAGPGLQAATVPSLKRKCLAAHLDMGISEPGGLDAPGKRRLCVNVSTEQAEGTSLEGSPRSQC